MNRKQYAEITKCWEQQYGVKSQAFRYAPGEISLACVKCGHHRVGGMSRHHKANDFFFALWKPDLYAKRYLEFRREDCAKLCQRCHKAIENFSTRLKIELYEDFERFDKIVDEKWCEEWRAKFVALFERWLAKPTRKHKGKSRSATKHDHSHKRPRRHRTR